MLYWLDHDDNPDETAARQQPQIVRILLVEDDQRFASSLIALLDAAGWEAEACATGQAGLDRLSRGEIDLVLVDIGLPDINGHEVIRRIRERDDDVSLIVVSGETEIDAAIGALRLGAADFVRKPVEPAMLLHSIRKTLKERRLEREHQSDQRRITQSERLHRFLVEQSPDVIFTLDSKGRITFINDRLTEKLGIPRETLLGQPFLTLVHHHDQGRAKYGFSGRKLMDGSQQHAVELRLNSMRDVKGYRHFDVHLASVPCPDGSLPKDDELCVYGVARDITERREAEAWAVFQANHDPLTGLPNRNLFRDRVGLAVIQARRNQENFAVIFLNIDRFSAINEHYGHARADELLQQVAERIQKLLRGGDTLARFSGDEFLLLSMPVRSEGDVLTIMDRINQEMALPFAVGEDNVHIAISAGISLYPKDGDVAETLIRHANIALYHSRMDKQPHSFFVEEMRTYADHRRHIEHDLRQAIEREEFLVYYQPQVDVLTHKVKGVEALVRWQHPERGLLAPGEFIDVAEETGLIIPISKLVIDQVCRTLVEWEARRIAPTRVSINLSPRCLEQQDFVPCFTKYMDQYQVTPDRIEIEITENMFIRDPSRVVHKLNTMASKGITIAIDDFGTQYSSLGYLQKFPIHTLKIDKSFVWEIDREMSRHAIIKAIVSIGHGLGLNLIAEGVETEEQMRFLELIGCNEVQGYLFSKPLPRAELEAMLDQQAVIGRQSGNAA